MKTLGISNLVKKPIPCSGIQALPNICPSNLSFFRIYAQGVLTKFYGISLETGNISHWVIFDPFATTAGRKIKNLKKNDKKDL